jgi:hypothetical protein
MEIKICKNCGVLYEPSIVKYIDPSKEYDGYGNVLCFKCRHNNDINRHSNAKLRGK